MLHVVCYDDSSKQSGRRQASISQRHLGSDIIIFGRNVHNYLLATRLFTHFTTKYIPIGEITNLSFI